MASSGRLQGKVAVITGGGSGIGEATARLLAAEGAVVHVFDLDAAGAERVAGLVVKAGGTAFMRAVDVSDQADMDRAFGEVLERSGGLNLLVNSVGVAHVGTLLTTEESDFDRLYRVNVKGTYFACKSAVKRMLPNGGGAHRQPGLHRLARRARRSVCVHDDERRRAHDDALHRRRLRPRGRPLQSRLPTRVPRPSSMVF